MKRLREQRLNCGMTQSAVALHLGVNRTTYTKYETGEREPDFSVVTALAELYGCTTDYLLGMSDNPTPEDKIELPEGLSYAHFQGIKELDNDDRRELIRMMERMIELDRLRKEKQKN